MPVWALGLSCEAPAAPKPLREPKRAHFKVPALQTPPKFNEKTPRERQKERKWWREREEKREILGHPSGFSPFGAQQFGSQQFGAQQFGVQQFGAPKGVCSSVFFFFFFFFILLFCFGQKLKHQFGPKSAWPKSAIQILAKVGQFN